ncbi:glutathione S-transferase family protein [Xanthomonas campestris pv. raphani]|uniref:glutathione S-transferase family protein n=1 Tax=Xanthomonas campestris TaxID=339 RepID=UPI0002FFE023|nr:glutathione S-transferase family protein [Xanthomonas campestris]MEA9776551.1 glutathione S-transferase family protein [Xanthomonas campestris pv. raphani]MEA9918593.1 glutathione S-transferase family protein [Xanthomonas campestris pv. raphani]
MGLLVDGKWQDRWYDTDKSDGRFERSQSHFRHWVTADGRAGPHGEGGFQAAPGRYHLYVSLACPWAHRTLIFRQLKGLASLIDVSVVHWLMGTQGWTFEHGPGVVGDSIHHAKYLYEVYLKADPQYSGRVTVPVLWDRERDTVVSNESADIIRMFNSAFDAVGAAEGDYYPEALRAQIDTINQRVYDTVNNGVYKAGFATTQAAYEEAVVPLFDTLDWLDTCLSTQRYLCGNHLTEADWRLFTTLIRFDAVYVGHFKCNLRRIADYPQLSGFLRELYQMPGIAETVNFQHIKSHYYQSHAMINPTGIVPMGPVLDLDAPHGRG